MSPINCSSVVVFQHFQEGPDEFSLTLCFFFRFHIAPSKMCMVGDRLDTDILFGQDGGCKTLLVLSGIGVLLV